MLSRELLSRVLTAFPKQSEFFLLTAQSFYLHNSHIFRGYKEDQRVGLHRVSSPNVSCYVNKHWLISVATCSRIDIIKC